MQERSFGMEFEISFQKLLQSTFERTELHIELFLHGKDRKISNFDLTYDEEMRLPLSKQFICEKSWQLKYIFTNSFRANYV